VLGDVVTLIVDLAMAEKKADASPGAGGGTYGVGRLEIEKNGHRVGEWEIPIVGITHQRYHVVAAVRTPGVTLTFLPSDS